MTGFQHRFHDQSPHPAWSALEATERVGQLVSTTLGPCGEPLVLLPGANSPSGQVLVTSSGYRALSGRRLGQYARSPGVLALLERSAAAMDSSCGGGTTSLLTMLSGAVRSIQRECHRSSGSSSFDNLQRVSMSFAEHSSWLMRRVIVPAIRELEVAEIPRDVWSIVTAVLHTAIAGKH